MLMIVNHAFLGAQTIQRQKLKFIEFHTLRLCNKFIHAAMDARPLVQLLTPRLWYLMLA